MYQKPPDLDEQGNPVTDTGKPPDLDAQGNPVSAAAPVQRNQGVDYGASLKKGFFEGIPEIDTVGALAKPAENQGMLGSIARGAMYPASVVDTLWNKGLKPLTTPANIAALGISIAQPEVAPFVGAAYAGMMGYELPKQVQGAAESYQEEGFSPQTIGKIGDVGASAAMIGMIGKHGISNPVARNPMTGEMTRPGPAPIRPPINQNLSEAIINGVDKGNPTDIAESINRTIQNRMSDAEKTRRFMSKEPVPPDDPNRIVGGPVDESIDLNTPIKNKYEQMTHDELAAEIDRWGKLETEKMNADSEFTPEELADHKLMIDEARKRTTLEDEVRPKDFIDKRKELTGEEPYDMDREESDIADVINDEDTVDMTGDVELDAMKGRLNRLNIKAKAVGLSPVEQQQRDALFTEVSTRIRQPRVADETFTKPEGYDSNRVLAIWKQKRRANEQPILPPEEMGDMTDAEIEHWQRQEAAKDWAEVKAKRQANQSPVQQPPTEQPRRGLTYVIKREQATREFIEKAQNDGYEFAGLNDNGDYRFFKPDAAPKYNPDDISFMARIPDEFRGMMREHSNSGIGIVENGRVEYKDLEGIDPTTETHYTHFRPTTDKGHFRYRDGEVIWNSKPTTEEMFRAEDNLVDRGLEVNSHRYADGQFIAGSAMEHFDPNVSERGKLIDEVTMDIRDEDKAQTIRSFALTQKGEKPHIAGKELVQNAVDAVKFGEGGKVKITYDDKDAHITVEDNGAGLPLSVLKNEYVNVTSSGKRGTGQKTTGEMGIGKTAYLLTGKKARIETVTREADGKLYRYELEGTPEEFLPGGGVKIYGEEVPEGTPTGTKVHVQFTDKDSFYGLSNYLKELDKYSNIPVDIDVENTYGTQSRYDITTNKYKTTPRVIDKTNIPRREVIEGDMVAEGSATGGNYRITRPKDAVVMTANEIPIVINVRGMFQGTDKIYLGRRLDVPSKLVLEVDPLVDGMHEDYPLTVPTREALKSNFRYEVKQAIEKSIVEGAIKEREKWLASLFNQIMPEPGSQHVVIDPSERMTPQEKAMYTGPTMTRLANLQRVMLNDLSRMFDPAGIWNIRSDGFYIENVNSKGQKILGINIRNPANANEFTIVSNPYHLLEPIKRGDFEQAADNFIVTMLHEFTHNAIRDDASADFTYMNADYVARFGARRQFEYLKKFMKIMEADHARGIENSELQNVLSRTEELFGRTKSKENALIAEAGSKSTTPNEPISNAGTNRQNGAGVRTGTNVTIKRGASPAEIKQLLNQGYRLLGEDAKGDLIFKKTAKPTNAPILESEVGSQRATASVAKAQLGPAIDVGKSNPWTEAWNLRRGLMASGDLSAMLRQGLPLIHKKEFWKAVGPMIQAFGSEDAFRASQTEIANRPLFKERIGQDGKKIPSFADDAGLKLSDLTSLSKREEQIMSTWAESGDFFKPSTWTKSKVDPNATPNIGDRLASGYKNSVGRYVRASNRAYVTFLNRLRADTFESLVQDGKVFGSDAKANVPLAREIANFVNTATGRGSLGALEKHAVLLNGLLFSPRLIASRLQMLNPHYYIMANPYVRKEALKSLFAVAAAGSTFLTLGKMAGGSVALDPTNSDFMKLKIGKVRLDPFAGFQQYAVAASRLMSQTVTSSTTGKKYDLSNPRGPFAPTNLSVISRFAQGKAHPEIAFAMALLNNKTEMSGEKMNFTTMNPFENAVAQRFMPIMLGDYYELAKNEPGLLPIAGPLSTFGMGVQSYEAGRHPR